MDMLQIRLIIDNVSRYGGFREKDIIKNLIKIELIQNDNNYKVYRFHSINNKYFDYDFKNNKIVG